MKQNLYEKLLDQMVTNRGNNAIIQACLNKYIILRKGGDTSASVVRELTNG